MATLQHRATDHYSSTVKGTLAVDGRTLCSVRRKSQKGIDELVRLRVKLPFSVQLCTG